MTKTAKTATIQPAEGVMHLAGKNYSITACINLTDGRRVPVANIPVMSDAEWKARVEQAKAKHPEFYAQAVRHERMGNI